MSKKILSCILVLSMVLSLGTPVFANSYSADIDIELEPLIMDVNVPTQLPLALDESGDMTVVGNATITNNGIAQVEITDITFIPAISVSSTAFILSTTAFISFIALSPLYATETFVSKT